MPRGDRAEVVNQMPTPVVAPTPVTMRMTAFRRPREKSSQAGSPSRMPLYSHSTASVTAPMASPWLMRTCSTATIPIVMPLPR